MRVCGADDSLIDDIEHRLARIVLEHFNWHFNSSPVTTSEDGEKVQHNSTQTPSDMSPPPLTDDFLPQAHHQNPGHCIASFNLINRMRNNFQLCDVKLEVGGEIIHAHKVILASASPYFYAMFNGNY